MNLVPSAHFIRDLHKLERGRLKEAVRKKLYQLRINPAYPSLRLHKIKGENTYSLSVTMGIRIIFSRLGDDVYLLRIGSHEEVY